MRRPAQAVPADLPLTTILARRGCATLCAGGSPSTRTTCSCWGLSGSARLDRCCPVPIHRVLPRQLPSGAPADLRRGAAASRRLESPAARSAAGVELA